MFSSISLAGLCDSFLNSVGQQHLWLIHGNLQRPEVWNQFNICQSEKYIVHKENLWLTEANDFESWAEAFCNKVKPYSTSTNKHHLIAYSLGGRLSFYAVLQNPELWSTVTIIAADTGLRTKEARKKQLAWDTKWAQKFLSEDWNSLVKEWNALAIFQNRANQNLVREEDFSREAIAKLFVQFSKAKQVDVLPLLTQKQLPPISYITGREDSKYCEKGQAIAEANSNISHRIIENAAHRVPWENSEAFEALLEEILNQV